MRRLTPLDRPELLVGAQTGDDAAVWQLSEERALVATADFITPVVDDARTWGRIAAANAVSDIYAMGADPLFALNLVGWNTDELSTDLLGEVLIGGNEIAVEAGFVVAGGHTIDDPEPKYGLAVIGEVHPERMITNAGLRPDDVVILTKPLGIGIISTAIKQDNAPMTVVAAAVSSMERLNRDAAAIARAAGVRGGTDVTGFGLLGHLGRMVVESAVDVEIAVDAVPVIEGTRELAEGGMIPGGSRRNLEWVAGHLDHGDRDDTDLIILADAQTSGGLMFGVSADQADGVLSELGATGHTAAAIGVAAEGTGRIRLR